MEVRTPPPLDEAGIDRLAARIARSRPALFLDYDGTLTPLAPRPELARLDPGMAARLERLARRCPVGIVSGRDLRDLQRMVGIPGLIYAGSHGFDIVGPGGRFQVGRTHLPALARAGGALQRSLSGVPGVLVERKRFALAVHTRQVPPDRKAEVERAVLAAAAGEPSLRRTGGKELHELRPDLPWDKGRAVLHLLEAEEMRGCAPVYVGDDLTDEDAFAALAGRGFAIRVDAAGGPTRASFVLRDVAGVGRLLDRTADLIGA